MLREVTVERDLLNKEASMVLEEYEKRFEAMEKRIAVLEDKTSKVNVALF